MACLFVLVLSATGPARAATAATSAAATTCASLAASAGQVPSSPAEEAVAAYRTACVLKEGGLDEEGVLAAAAKAAEIDPTVAPPDDLLADHQPPLVSASRTIADMALAVATIAGVIAAVVIGLLFVGTMAFRATLGRSRTLRNMLGFRPAMTVEPAVAGGSDEHRTLPSLLQSVLGNLGNDIGGQNIQFVSPSSDDVSEVTLSASAPAQLEYLSWVVALLRPLAPKDRVTLRLAVQPEGRQGLGLTATLVGGHKGRTLNATTLWEAEIGLGGIANDEPLLSERERYQLLVAPLGAWVYFTLADLTQRDEQLLGTRNWRSYGLFSLGCRLYQTHRQRGQRLLREAIDADPANLGAHLNILLLEFDSRRTDAGKQQLRYLRAGVEALPVRKLCPRGVRDKRESYWYDSTWYRTMYSLTAVCSHMVSRAANGNDDGLTPADVEALRLEGVELAMELLRACWITLNDVLGPDGKPPAPSKRRGRRRRTRHRQRHELALFLNQMLPSSVMVLVNLQLLDRTTPVLGTLAPGSKAWVAGSADHRKREWKRRADVLCALEPDPGARPVCPPIDVLLSVIDPVEFLPARARYNVACVHSEAAQYQDPSVPDAARHAAKSRELALEELAKGLDHDSAQWAREDPALWHVRANHATRPAFADLVAKILCTPIEWAILAELPFIGVAGASRLSIGGHITSAASLAGLGEAEREADRAELLDNPSGARWLEPEELDTWVARARLRAHLAAKVDDAGGVDRIEGLLHRLRIATPAELSSDPPWVLSRKLVELAPEDPDGLLTPSAVEVWAA